MNPIPEWDGKGYDGKEIAPGVFVLGDIHWNEEAQQFRCLVSCSYGLCLAAVRARRTDPTEAPR